MSPRPRRISDQQLLQISIQVVQERGADQLRLADVAAASGLAPATLVQRFGSREALLDAATSMLTHQIAEAFSRAGASALDRLRAGLQRISEDIPFRLLINRSAATSSLEIRLRIAYCLAAAVENHEIPPCDVAQTARYLQLVFYGELMASLLEGRAVDHGTWTATMDEYGQ